jgi:hypothetical protein
VRKAARVAGRAKGSAHRPALALTHDLSVRADKKLSSCRQLLGSPELERRGKAPILTSGEDNECLLLGCLRALRRLIVGVHCAHVVQGPHHGRIEVTPGSVFTPGTIFMGVDLAAWLDKQADEKSNLIRSPVRRRILSGNGGCGPMRTSSARRLMHFWRRCASAALASSHRDR